MKKSICVIAMLLLEIIPVFAQTPFNRGVNLTGWFQVNNPREIQFTKFTKKDFEDIKSLGCDVIRLPINLHSMTNGSPNYNLDPLFLNFLDQVVDWTEDLQLHLILDNHSFDPAVNTDPNIGDVLVKVWRQMATHFKNRSNLVYYEVLNEPHGISDVLWGQIQQNVITAIREIDPTHFIVVGPANWNSFHNLQNMPFYTDDKLIYTFHFYDPFLFTHQGASWVDPSMVPLSGVPFPYKGPEMPTLPESLKNSWIESAFNNYQNDGTVAKVKELIDIALAFKTQRNVPIFCGEFGVYIPNSPNEDRVFWYEEVRKYFEEKSIPWTIWDYTGGFGIFKPGGNDLFEHDLNIPLIEALGLTAPEQQEYVLLPDEEGFIIYSDFVGEKIVTSAYGGNIDLYSTAQPNNGLYCLSWSDGSQYATVSFDFKPNKDLSILVQEDYSLDLILRGDSPGTKFDIRFIDTKTDEPGDRPWRMRFTIDETIAPWDGKWHHLRIPLQNFTEHGSWDDDNWFNPEGKFDWSAIDRLEIVAEHQSLHGTKFWFDNIFINNQDTARAHNYDPIPVGLPKENNLISHFTISPNPIRDNATISFTLQQKSRVNINIYNMAGQKVKRLVNEIKTSGEHVIAWDGRGDSGMILSEGIYICRLATDNQIKTIKLLK